MDERIHLAHMARMVRMRERQFVNQGMTPDQAKAKRRADDEEMRVSLIESGKVSENRMDDLWPIT